MPYTISKLKSGSYKVESPHGTKAKATTKEKAESQARLLRAVEHNPEFRKKMSMKHGQKFSGGR